MKQSFYKIEAPMFLLPLSGLGGFLFKVVAGFLLWMFPLWLLAQTSTQNYIVTTAPYQKVSDPTTLTDANSNTGIQYFDGLGRPSQTVQRAITPTEADLVSGIEYDDFGRDYRHWLPGAVAGNNGAYVSEFGAKATSTNGGDTKPYTETILESSPLNRTLGQHKPGADWSEHPTGVSYLANDAGEVISFSTENNQLKQNGNYYSGTLYKTLVTDEDGKPGTEYKNKQGQVVMKRSEEGGQHVDTYFVYNDLGQLSYVIPPKAVDELTDFSDDNAIMKQYCYLYKYDERGNNIQKRLPGCDYIYLVYDKAYRLVLSQDGNQRTKKQQDKKQWTATKYDALGRVIFTGTTYVDSTKTVQSLNADYSTQLITETYNTGTGYTNQFFADASPLTINYYDSYDFINLLTVDADKSTLPFFTLDGYDDQFSTAKGLLTGNRVYHLNDPTKFEATALYYDKYGRVVQTRASNHLGGYDLVYNHLDFTGKPTRTYKTHGINGASDTYTELYRYDYDKAQRMLTTTYSLNSATAVTLVSNSYDELGRLKTKNLGGVDATSYSYNVRSWTTGISGSRFTENLYYNVNTDNLPTFTACYNGNIAGMQWSVPSETLGYNRAYTFVYDGLNRLTDANYCGFNGSAVAGTTGRYDEHFGFDKMGNFSALTRTENGTSLNDLSFTYTGNQLKKVDHSPGTPYIPYGSEAFNDKRQIETEYKYDKNGSITYDANTGISTIQYNILNLPDQIQFTEGHKNLYTYDAAGKKLEAINYTVNDIVNVPMDTISVLPSPSRYTKLTTDYVGNMIYENGALKEILLPEGYYQGGVYHYYLKDHLGNNRVVINNSGTVMEKSHYYPSGMRFYPESTSDSSALPYRYNGKELEAMNGLNQMDYGARRRGAGLPVWTAVDPLAEKYYSISPYAYCAGNPVRYIDPNGKSVYGIDANGHFKLITINKDKTDQLYVMKNKKEIDKSKTFLTMSKNIMGSLKSNEVKTTDGKTAHYVSMHVDGNNKGAETAFKWLSNNTSVEWSRLNVGDSNTISTSRDNGGEIGGQAELLKSLSSGTKNAILDHSHPLSIGGTYPSGFGKVGEGNYGDKGSDKKAAQQIQSEYHDAKVTNRVYDQYLDDYIKYDSNGIIGY